MSMGRRMPNQAGSFLKILSHAQGMTARPVVPTAEPKTRYSSTCASRAAMMVMKPINSTLNSVESISGMGR